MSESSSLSGLLVSLKIEQDHALFVLLDRDGTVNRMGDGVPGSSDRDMFVGVAGPEIFGDAVRSISSDLNQWLGSRQQHPGPKGKICTLTVGIRRNGEELVTEWVYGSESIGPPPEVTDVVRAAARATAAWHEKQKKMVTASLPPPKQWWELWKRK